MGDITAPVADLYRHAVITKLAYERVRARIMTISRVLNHTKTPELWRGPAKRAIKLGQKYRRRMQLARENARLALLYDSHMPHPKNAELDSIVKAFEARRRKALS